MACWSEKGETARRLSRQGFRIPVLAFSSDVSAVRRMALLYAVRPVHFPSPPAHRSDFTKLIDRFVQEHGIAARGDVLVVVSGKPLGKPGTSDSVTVQVVGDG